MPSRACLVVGVGNTYTSADITPVRTIMVEKMDVMPDVIEAQLAHGKSGPLAPPMAAPSSWPSGGP